MKVGMLGDGAWGSACALLFAHNGHQVDLWCFNPDVADEIEKKRTNSRFLPGFTFPSNIIPTTNLTTALSNDVVCEAVPVPFLRKVLTNAAIKNADKKLWVILSKGIEDKTLKLPLEIIEDLCGVVPRRAIISGPSFAKDLAAQQPTAVSLAIENKNDADLISNLCENEFFSCVPTSDIIGTQLLGALKNITALGAGFIDGAGFGCNTRVLFVIRCMGEMQELLVACGGQKETLLAPAGIGDLMLTCFAHQSRNYQYGKLRGSGTNSSHINGITAEGLNTLGSICTLAAKHNLSLPVICTLSNVVIDGKNVSKLIKTLKIS